MTITVGVSPITGNAATQEITPRGVRRDVSEATLIDVVEFSPEADAAAVASRAVEQNAHDGIRADVVEAARKRVQEGSYRVQEIVSYVAMRIAGAM
jgi:hypothetical protein